MGHSPSMIILCETRQSKEKLYHIRNRLGLRGFEGVSILGNSGGLDLFWHKSLYVDVQDFYETWIDAYRLPSNDQMWRVTFVLANCLCVATGA